MQRRSPTSLLVVKPRLLITTLLLPLATAHSEETVYLKPVGSRIFNRYELLSSRPLFPDKDVISVPACRVEGLQQVTALEKSGNTIYVVPRWPGSQPPRFEIYPLPPGVSYMQSIGGGVGRGGGYSSVSQTPAPTPTPKPQRSVSAPAVLPPSQPAQVRPPSVSRRPFGWPTYANPLEQRPRR